MGKIFWVASYPKSGNTWVRAFLANLLLAGEAPLPLNQIPKGCQSEAVGVWYKPLLANPNVNPGELARQRVMRLRPLAQKRIVDINDTDVFIKTHNLNATYLGHPLIRRDVTLGAVYVVRDPRDVVVSAAHHWGFSYDRMVAALENPDFMTDGRADGMVFERLSSWSNHVASWTQLRFPNRFVFRYEDLLKDPLGNFGKLAKTLQITDDMARIRQVVDWTRFDNLQTREAAEGFAERSNHTDRFFRQGTAGAWRDHLTAAQVARIERSHGRMMRAFGYL